MTLYPPLWHTMISSAINDPGFVKFLLASLDQSKFSGSKSFKGFPFFFTT